MSIKKICTCSFLIAIAILFQLIEASIPLPFVVPGIKLGLANCVAVIVLYLYDGKTMFIVNMMRVILASLIRGSIFQISFLLSLSGALFSVFMMIVIKKITSCSVYGVSMGGSAAHVIAQVIVIMILYEQWRMISILPILLICAIPTGFGVAVIAKSVLRQIVKEDVL